jgi:hypothetical protein
MLPIVSSVPAASSASRLPGSVSIEIRTFDLGEFAAVERIGAGLDSSTKDFEPGLSSLRRC